jgi:hypothetical protein
MWYADAVGASPFVGARLTISPRVRRLMYMRAAELGLSNSQYVAALIIADTKHLGSIESEDNNGGNEAA